MRWSDVCKDWDCPLSSRRHPDRDHRKGYVSLLAMSFAFGLAVFGGALAVGLRAYLVAAATQQREILDRITLESAAHEVLGRLSAGQVHSIRPSRLDDIALNSRQVSIDLSLPEGKYDLGTDPDSTVLGSLRDHGLGLAVGQKPVPSSFQSLEAMSRGWRMSAAEEDCLRQLITVGRAPEEFRPEAAPGKGDALTRSIASGDQVDIRTSLEDRSGRRVLWMRARFSGYATRPWQVHDFRRLTLTSPAASCTPA